MADIVSFGHNDKKEESFRFTLEADWTLACICLYNGSIIIKALLVLNHVTQSILLIYIFLHGNMI